MTGRSKFYIIKVFVKLNFDRIETTIENRDMGKYEVSDVPPGDAVASSFTNI